MDSITQADLIDEIIGIYNTGRPADVPAAQHILSFPSVQRAFAAHRRTAQAELVEALDNLLDLYTRWRRQFGSTQGDIDSEAYVHDARAALSKYRTDATKGGE